ncbi:diacylglycerol kinase iota-like isoform X2 [Gigantopelta aegis]|uniref:diacylglycerol kinase iota-like isoform X2 n=1 Tax=Gigantopelta aegis TaxID=1735272 RepID=UPI001B88806B|nr:diacylglycerol kinase iota-like isoform X2 [Gigantopelta aegis]
MANYEALHYDKDKLREVSVPLGIIVVDNSADLEQVREKISKLSLDIHNGDENNEDTILDNSSSLLLSKKWCFLDSTTAERFFRIDRAQEHLHYITDISSEDLYILDPDLSSNVAIVTTSNGDSHPVITDVGNCQKTEDGELIFTFPLPVTPPKSPNRGRFPDNVLIQRPESSESLLVPLPPGSNNSSEPGSPNSPVTQERHYQFTSVSSATADNKTQVLSPLDKGSRSVGLIDASKRGDIEKLVESYHDGATLLVTDQYGMTALHHAARFGHKAIVQFLIQSAPPVILDMVDQEKGQTALHKAAWYQRRTICHMLVAAGASLTRTDYQGNTPQQQALKAEDSELAAYLQNQEHFQLVASEDQETAV